MTVQLFVDESKRGGFAFAVVAVDAHRVKDRRRWLRGQLLPGQERIHFTDERRTRRQQLIAGIAGWSPPPEVHILASGNRYQSEAREECIAMLPDLVRRTGANLVVVERDDSRYESDRRALTRRLTGQAHPVRWEILRAKDDPLLWCADAMAWCWTNPDPDWRRRIAPLIASVTESRPARDSAKPGTPTVRKATGLTSQDSCPSPSKDMGRSTPRATKRRATGTALRRFAARRSRRFSRPGRPVGEPSRCLDV